MKKLIVVLLLSLLSCSKQEIEPKVSVEEFSSRMASFKRHGTIEVDNFAPPGGFKTNKRTFTAALRRASESAGEIGKAIGKGKHPRPPKGDTTNPPPPPTDTTGSDSSEVYVLFLDFDGGEVDNTSWNYSGPFHVEASGLLVEDIAFIIERVQRDYLPYGIIVTADSTEYLKRAPGKRQKAYITQSHEWYGNGAGGVAYVGSMFTGTDSPCFIFTALLGYNAKYVADASSHEAGHTLNLRHQADWKDGIMTSGYSYGFTANEAPIMGVSYYDADGGTFVRIVPQLSITTITWYIRTAAFIDQNDHEIILSKIGARKY